MRSKLFEIRDRATLMPVLAIQISGKDGPLAERAGFDQPQIILIDLENSRCNWDEYEWNGARTLPNAHAYIKKHWRDLTDGDVIDVEFILGETKVPKISECCGSR
jgi:hypothetical protein